MRDLEKAVREAIAILRRYAETWWLPQLETALQLIERRDAAGLQRLLWMYGGMGSINDLAIMHADGYQIAECEEKAVNDALRSCLSRAYELALTLLRQT